MANITKETLFIDNRMAKLRVARVVHKCSCCGGKINVGEKYVHCTQRQNNTITHLAYHTRCWNGPKLRLGTKKYLYRLKKKEAVSDGATAELRVKKMQSYFNF